MVIYSENKKPTGNKKLSNLLRFKWTDNFSFRLIWAESVKKDVFRCLLMDN